MGMALWGEEGEGEMEEWMALWPAAEKRRRSVQLARNGITNNTQYVHTTPARFWSSAQRAPPTQLARTESGVGRKKVWLKIKLHATTSQLAN